MPLFSSLPRAKSITKEVLEARVGAQRASVLPGRGDGAADLVEPVRHKDDVVQGSFLRRFRRLEHDEAFPVGIEGEVPLATTVCKLPLRSQTGPWVGGSFI